MATLVLASLGADVIKVERIDGGDDARHMGPHLRQWSSVFLPLNRGKRSIAADITKPRGRELVLRLARKSDVFIENFRSGKMAALGLGEDAIREQNPGVIYASLTAFGSCGPEAQSPGYEALIQGRSGIMSVTGPGPGAAPARAGVPIIDGSAGLWIAINILAALLQRQKSGEGQQVETSLLEAGVMLMFHNLVGQQFSGSSPVPQGSSYPSFGLSGGAFSPYGAYQTADGWLMLGVSNDRIFARLCRAIDHTEWASDPRFLTNVLRLKHRAELNEVLQRIFLKKSSAEWKVVATTHDVPISPIQNTEQVLDDPQVVALGQLESLELPEPGKRRVKVPRAPLHFSKAPNTRLGFAPTLGEHGREILREAGYTDAEADVLAKDAVCDFP
jgi:crotonobetainyl-CoA:carnitine CoA-transferase CaiB-like acyl-CoA transferase